jgi:hypothetical protein
VTEAELLKRLMPAVSKVGTRIFRNHVGGAWQGDATVIGRPGMYQVQTGRRA